MREKEDKRRKERNFSENLYKIRFIIFKIISRESYGINLNYGFRETGFGKI